MCALSRAALPQQSSWPLLTPLLFATIYFMSGLHLTGYRPLVTRRIGQERHAERNAQASSLKPIDDAYGQSSEEISQLAPRPEPGPGLWPEARRRHQLGPRRWRSAPP